MDIFPVTVMYSYSELIMYIIANLKCIDKLCGDDIHFTDIEDVTKIYSHATLAPSMLTVKYGSKVKRGSSTSTCRGQTVYYRVILKCLAFFITKRTYYK